MQPSQWEVIILKPTKLFLAFLASQLPDVELPSLKLLNTDNTAYVIPKQADDEATLNEIERHFPDMFRHEISRWLGNDACNDITGSFLDFLCCFKFELHTHIVLMEKEMGVGQNLLRIKPRAVLLKWMRSAVEEQSDLVEIMANISLSQLAENATVIVKNFKDLTEIKPFLQQYYRPIVEAEMLRMCDDSSQWPEINSYEQFNQYFTINIHTQLIHLH